jgi:hypothetical protein
LSLRITEGSYYLSALADRIIRTLVSRFLLQCDSEAIDEGFQVYSERPVTKQGEMLDKSILKDQMLFRAVRLAWVAPGIERRNIYPT